MKWIAVFLLFFAACGPKLQPATPKADAAIKADAVMIRLNEVQSTLKAFCGPPPTCAPNTIDTAKFLKTVETIESVRKTLLQVPSGWLATARSGWSEIKNSLLNVTNPALQAAIAAVDAVLGAL